MWTRSFETYIPKPLVLPLNIGSRVISAIGAHGICIAGSGAGVAALVSTALIGKVAPAFVAINFLIVFASYRIDYLAERLNSHRSINVAITIGCFLLVFAVCCLISISTALVSLLFPLSTFYYARPLIPGRVRAPKDIPFLKAIYTSGCWAALVPFGMLYFSRWNFIESMWLGIFVFLRMFVNSVACDFKDMDADQARCILTLQSWLGQTKTLLLLYIVNLVAALLMVMVVILDQVPTSMAWLGLSAIWPAFYLDAINRGRVDLRLLSSTLIDGEFLLWIPLLAMAS
jgi:hypothetical protein